MDNKLEEFGPSPLIEAAKIFLPLIRKKLPPEIERWEIIQEIQVYDPRKIICGDDIRTKVIVQRIQIKKPIFKNPEDANHFHFHFVKIIEVLKEYTFEDWDKGNEWND